jgi:hypothetical protein
MSDTEAPINPEVGALVPDNQRDNAIALFRKAGFNEEKIAAAFGRQAPPKAPPGDVLHVGKGGGEPAKPQTVYTGSNLPYEDRVKGLNFLIKHGMTLDRIIAAAQTEHVELKDLNVTPPPGVDPSKLWADVTEKMALPDARAQLHQNEPPLLLSGQPNEYSFQFDRALIADMTPDEVRQASDHFANAFSAGEIPVSVSQSLFQAMQDAQMQYEKITDPNDLKLKFAVEGSKINRLSGDVGQIRADHELAFSKLPEAFRKWATANRVFHTADSFTALANAGRLMRQRAERRSKK